MKIPHIDGSFFLEFAITALEKTPEPEILANAYAGVLSIFSQNSRQEWD